MSGRAPSASPRILLVATSCWIATARLAMAFARAGCVTEVVCPRAHPVTRTHAAARVHRYRVWAPLRSVDAAIRAARPDLVIPCDDLATSHLLRLHARAACADARGACADAREACADAREVLEASLGEPSSMALATARSELMACARALGIRSPATAVVRTRAELAAWLDAHGCPAVLKTDGSYGGRGVRIVHSPAEAHRAWDLLSALPSAGRALKRALVNRDMNYLAPWLRRTRPTVNAQRFVAGQDANCTVACWKGTVLASITVAVLRTVGPRGPASVIRPIEHREIQAAVETLVGRLKISGLIGLDFLLEDGTGDAHLIELNPRAPQVGHLPLGPGRDLPAALRAVMCGEPIRRTPPVTEADVIALFPQEWMRDAESPFLRTAYHDVPWEEPDLLRACVVEPIAIRAWSALSGR